MVQFLEWQLPSVLVIMLHADPSLEVPGWTVLAIPVLLVVGVLYARRTVFEVATDGFVVCNGLMRSRVPMERVSSIDYGAPPGFWAFYGEAVTLRSAEGQRLASPSLATLWLSAPKEEQLVDVLTRVAVANGIEFVR